MAASTSDLTSLGSLITEDVTSIRHSEQTRLVQVNLDKPRYDQTHFFGRLRHFMQVTDVRNLFVTDARLKEAQTLIQYHVQQGSPSVTPEHAERLWKARKVVAANIHPDTGDKIPAPFRISAFVPMNVFICLGMLAPNPGVGSVIFWQWVNQSYNIGVNHSNRNASNEMSNSTVAKTYAAAVAISCGVALGLRQIVKNANSFSPAVRTSVQRFVPYSAVAIAGCANVFMMRGNEMREGISVRDEEGREVGRSPKAGQMACTQVALSRCISSLPCLTLPPLMMSAIQRTRWYTPRMNLPLNLACITAMLFTGLPVAVAMFPQEVSTPVEKLEEEFRGLQDSEGRPIKRVFYNRGL
ncbi:hypothetical protein PROFUN_09889 [Planoprotostelium fungivorum]|uniref:Sidoreflexin n=1 Tax=Planoprotostelium fungivorum TaxID=1890364 RepID=A0A2P6NGF3_9EUKA|nr:hypothetical protein PROFUN_09889 [Planoprotostelium fungivorum]